MTWTAKHVLRKRYHQIGMGPELVEGYNTRKAKEPNAKKRRFTCELTLPARGAFGGQVRRPTSCARILLEQRPAKCVEPSCYRVQVVVGKGPTKKLAEQAAAAQGLKAYFVAVNAPLATVDMSDVRCCSPRPSLSCALYNRSACFESLEKC